MTNKLLHSAFSKTLLGIALATLVLFPPLPNLESITPEGFNFDIGIEVAADIVLPSYKIKPIDGSIGGGYTALGVIAIIGLIAAIVAIVAALITLVAWIWKQATKGHRRCEWERFKDEIIANKNSCAKLNGNYKSDHPPQWTCESSNGTVLLSGDYSDIFSGTPWDGDPLNWENTTNSPAF